MAKPARDVEQQQTKPKGKRSSKSSSKTAAAPNSSSTAFTKKRIETAKPNSKAPLLSTDLDESELLKGTDLSGDEKLRMSGVTVEPIGEDQKPKAILAFAEIDKRLALNKTNRKVLEKALGNDMHRWVGHDVILFPAMVPFKGEVVQAVRLRLPGSESSGGSSLRRKG